MREMEKSPPLMGIEKLESELKIQEYSCPVSFKSVWRTIQERSEKRRFSDYLTAHSWLVGAPILAAMLLFAAGITVATGLLFGRVSRPSARVGFSEAMLVAPYRDGLSLQFRVVNRRPNSRGSAALETALWLPILLVPLVSACLLYIQRGRLGAAPRPGVLGTVVTGAIGLAALAGAAFFALHPMRVEAVAWVSGRKDLLATAFFLGSLLPRWTALRSAETWPSCPISTLWTSSEPDG